MRHIKMAFGLVVVAGLMAVVAAPSMALGPRWVHCVKVAAGTGKWTNNKCTTAGTGEWETKGLTETSELTSSTVPGTKGLELEDTKATGGATSITCVGTGTGTAGENGTDSVKTIKATECKFVAGKSGSCETSKPVTATPRNLGWSTRLEERENTTTHEIELRDIVTSLISGKTPGYAVECTVGGIFKITDECTGIISTSVKANRAEGTVETEFDSVSEKELGTCTVGGAGAGRVSGNVINRLRSGALWVLASILHT